MGKKLIEVRQDHHVVCDNQNCDFSVKNETKDANVDLKEFINMPCPQCGDNLLTKKDYIEYMKFLNMINWINKYFSWLRFFYWGKKETVHVHAHDGLKITKKDE